MPNMDDIAFFETSALEHRGGIWSDACRKPHQTTTVSSSTQEDVQSVPSAPSLDQNTNSSVEYVLPVPPEMKPAEEPVVNVVERSASAPVEIPTITKIAEEGVQDSSRNSSKRRSWFASVRSDDQSLLSELSASGNGDETRGRTLEADSESSSPRSQSTPKPTSMLSTTTDRSDRSDSGESGLEPQSSRHRSSSSVSGIRPLVNEMAKEGGAKSTPTTPRKNSDASEIARSASPPSFFSTLKSRTDKQAISNTAKEAMRKWGVNWGGFKKEASNGSSSDETSQPASSTSRSTLSENANLLAQKARASYAEVRAAVAERKERNHDENSGASSPSSSLFSVPRQRVLSNPLNNLPNSSVYSDAPSNPSIITSAARLTTPKLTSKKSTPSLSRVSTEIDAKDLPELVEPVKHAPIHVQPQAKTMSIPGIHVSHRGELQSMGYVAPQPSAPQPTNEAMLKNPAIQTVYRLWKNPSSQGGQDSSETRTEEVPSSGSNQTSPHEECTSVKPFITNNTTIADASHTTPLPTQSPPSPPQQVLVKPTPPPLPPRSTTAPRPVMIVSGDSPSASETLKSIVERDDNHHQRIQTPPLTEFPGPASGINDASSATVKREGIDAVVPPRSAQVEADSGASNTVVQSPQVQDQQNHQQHPKTAPALPPRRIPPTTMPATTTPANAA